MYVRGRAHDDVGCGGDLGRSRGSQLASRGGSSGGGRTQRAGLKSEPCDRCRHGCSASPVLVGSPREKGKPGQLVRGRLLQQGARVTRSMTLRPVRIGETVGYLREKRGRHKSKTRRRGERNGWEREEGGRGPRAGREASAGHRRRHGGTDSKTTATKSDRMTTTCCRC